MKKILLYFITLHLIKKIHFSFIAPIFFNATAVNKRTIISV